MYAVIMAGGKGERLWPKSTKNRAKHILTFGTKNVMIKETIKRLRKFLPLENIFLVTTKAQYRGLRPYILDLNKDNIILEPEGRDTLPAIALSAFILQKRFGGEVTMVVLPSDHIIKDSDSLYKNLVAAKKIAASGNNLVTIGIKPRYPAVGYGYIEISRPLGPGNYYRVKRFIEKPIRQKAERFYKKDNYLWNSGIFVWRLDSILNAVKRFTPNVYYGLKDVLSYKDKKAYFAMLSNVYSGLEKISVDYGIMEKIVRVYREEVFCIKGSFDWIDIGSWSSLEEIYDKDKNGNILLANSSIIDVKNSIILGEPGHKIGAIGLNDVIIIQTRAGTLVCNKARAQEVKDLVMSFSLKR